MNRKLTLVSLFILATCLSGCTLIRYVDNGDGDSPPTTQEPRYVQALILVDLPRGAANIMSGYADYIGHLQMALALQNIELTHAAFAPLYRQQRHQPPLLYGEGDPYAHFHNFHEALTYYVSDEGLAHLDSASDADGENLATLGLNLDRESIFNPSSTPPETKPYFDAAQDGLLIIYLTGSARQCAYDSPDCALDQQKPAQYFTQTDPDTGLATWLTMADNTGLPPSKILHISIATPENIDYDTFADRCLREPHFPANHLDIIEPSNHKYFGPLMSDLNKKGGQGIEIDLCTAFSSRAERSAISTASQINRAIRQD